MYSVRLTNHSSAVGDRLLQAASEPNSLLPCDFTLIAGKDGGRRPVHSFVLQEASDFFRPLVTNSEFVEFQTREAQLTVDSETLRLLLKWMYSRNDIVISVDQAVPLYIAAQLFLMDDLARPLREFLLDDAAVLSFLGSELFLRFTPLNIMGLADVLLADELRAYRRNILRHLHRWLGHSLDRSIETIFDIYHGLARGSVSEANIYLFGPWSISAEDSTEVSCYRFSNDRLEETTLHAPTPQAADWFSILPDNLCFLLDNQAIVLDESKVMAIDFSTGRVIQEAMTPFDCSERTDIGVTHFQNHLFLWIGLEIYVQQADGSFAAVAMCRELIRRMFIRRFNSVGILDFVVQAAIEMDELDRPVYGTNPVASSIQNEWSIIEPGTSDLLLLGICADKVILYRAGEVLVKGETSLLGSIPVPPIKNGYSIAYGAGQILIAGPTAVEVIDIQTFSKRSIPFAGHRLATLLRTETFSVRPIRPIEDNGGARLP